MFNTSEREGAGWCEVPRRHAGVPSTKRTPEVHVVSSRLGADTPAYSELGDRLRAARSARGLSLRSLADRVGVSPSLISQVERGLARPSVNTLYAMARELDVSFDALLFPDVRPPSAHRPADPRPPATSTGDWPSSPARPVQRAASRRSIRLASGVVWERLTTESLPSVDFLYVTYEVGGASSPEHEFQRHGGQEWGYVLTGRLGVTIGFDDHILEVGDAIALDSTVPHRLYNVGDEPVHAIWFVHGRQPVDAGAPPADDAEPAVARPDGGAGSLG
jgi:transcriptional regulator with XRE-family HTH domain/quercetin dioxygenase-like cupin family protein